VGDVLEAGGVPESRQMSTAGEVLGVGIDLVDVDRVGGLLARRPAAEARLFTERERAYCRRFHASAERYAVRVAAKEAVGKALGSGIVGWREVEGWGGGKPRVRLSGRTEQAARERGVQRIELSLTHTAAQAAAVAVAVGKRPAAGEGSSARVDASYNATTQEAAAGGPAAPTNGTAEIAEGGAS